MLELREINRVSEKWTNSHTVQMEFHVKRLRDTLTSNYSEVIQLSAPLLTYPKLGSSFYDIILDLHDESVSVETITNRFKEIVDNIKVFDAVIELRNIIDSQYHFGTDLISTLLRASLLIVHSYGYGNMFGINSKEEVVIFSNSISPYDMYLSFYLAIAKRKKLVARVSPKFVSIEGNKKKFDSHLKTIRPYLVPDLNNIPDKTLIELFNNMTGNVFYSGTSAFFNEIDDSFLPQTSYFFSSTWEREDFGKASSAVVSYFRLLIDQLVKRTVLKERDFYVRDKGVKIVFPTPIDGISHIELREFHSESPYEEHFISLHYCLNESQNRMFHLNMKDITTISTFMLYEKDVTAVMLVLNWLGVLEDIDTSPKNLNRIFKEEGQVVNAKTVKNISEGVTMWLGYYEVLNDSTTYYYETPSHWNYDSPGARPAKTKVNNKERETNKLVTVGRYTRRLPAGQLPSASAKELARKYYMELKEGYTLVDEFERKTRT